MSFIEDFLNLFAPHECLLCRKEGDVVCRSCLGSLATIPPRCYSCKRLSEGFRTCERCRRTTPLPRVWSVTPYEGVAKDMIYRLKFGRTKAAAGVMGRALATICDVSDDVVVTHIPTANQRVRERGYDQAALIAAAVASELQLPHHTILARLGGQRQVGQTRKTRKQQMEGVFRPLKTSVFQDKHILLIDDVLTTGATCEAAARVLRQAGAKQVSAAVFAAA